MGGDIARGQENQEYKDNGLGIFAHFHDYFIGCIPASIQSRYLRNYNSLPSVSEPAVLLPTCRDVPDLALRIQTKKWRGRTAVRFGSTQPAD